MEIKNIKQTIKFTLECEYEIDELRGALGDIKQFQPYNEFLEDLEKVLEKLAPEINEEDE